MSTKKFVQTRIAVGVDRVNIQEFGVRDMRNVSYTVLYDGRKISRMVEKAARHPKGVAKCANGAIIVTATITGGGT